MVTFDPALQALLSAPGTKLGWSSIIATALGATRRLRCFRDSNASAVRPFLTGVEFLNVGMTGALKSVAGNITDFGITVNTSIKLAADLSTGASILRVEGNGHWVEYTLGLTGATKDYVMPASPTASLDEGVAFALGSGWKAPAALNSGTGPLAPPMPLYTAEIEDWTGGAFVKVLGVLTPSKKLINWVYDDQEMATSQGDVLTLISPTTVVHGDIEFGMMVWCLNGVTNSETSDPVDEILITQKPLAANWPGYPAMSGYNAAVSNTYAPPFKVRIKKDGVVVKVHEMRDGLAINDQTLNQATRATPQNGPDPKKTYFKSVDVAPMRPFVGCTVPLPFRSRRLKMHTYATKYYPGQELEVLRASTAKQKASTNAAFPMSYAANTNGMNNWHGMGKWATQASQAAFNANPNQDPMGWSIYTGEPSYGSMGSGVTNTTGWGYEPGANGGHDWYTGNGGARIDRGNIAGPIAIYLTDKTFVHKRDMTPIQEMVDNWNLNYCNIPWHMITDVTTGDTIPFDEVCNGVWSQGGSTYYGGQYTYVSGGAAKSINFLGWGNGPSYDYSKMYDGALTDKNFLMPFHGAMTDFLHPYKSAAQGAYIFNSPMYAYLAKFAVINVIIAQLGDVSSTKFPSWFLVRQHAWRFKAYSEAWKLSSDHPWGMKRAWIVKRWQEELEVIHDQLYLPVVVNNSQDRFMQALRNLGLPTNENGGGATQSLMFYMAGVMQQMKSTGSWDFMRAQSNKCKLALNFMVQCMDRYSIDWIIETNGQYEWYEYGNVWKDGNLAAADSWAEVAANRRARNPGDFGQDWVTNTDGSPRGESDGSMHLRYQWACIRRDWITETEVPRGSKATIADGIAKYKGYYDVVTARVNAAIAKNPSDAFTICKADWAFRQPMYGVILPPVASGS